MKIRSTNETWYTNIFTAGGFPMKEKDPNNSKSKKVISTVLATVLIVAGISVTAFAAQGEDE